MLVIAFYSELFPNTSLSILAYPSESNETIFSIEKLNFMVNIIIRNFKQKIS